MSYFQIVSYLGTRTYAAAQPTCVSDGYSYAMEIADTARDRRHRRHRKTNLPRRQPPHHAQNRRALGTPGTETRRTAKEEISPRMNAKIANQKKQNHDPRSSFLIRSPPCFSIPAILAFRAPPPANLPPQARITAHVDIRVVHSRQLRLSKAKSRREPWQREILSHAPEYAAEFLGTLFLVFCVVAAVAVMFASGSPVLGLIPSARVRLFLTGSLLGAAGGLVAIAPLGRISGAHLNPAISLGFFVEGKMQLQDLFGYIVAQLGGAILGACAGAAAAGAFGNSVHEALNLPARGVSDWAAAAAEVLATFSLAFIIFEMLSLRKWMRWTPLVAVGIVSVIVGIDGNYSGASLNPARSFGPAFIEHHWSSFWIYAVGPSLGGLLAGLLHRFMPHDARTGKLFHDRHYRSIFSGRSDRAANIHVRRLAGARPGTRPPVREPPPSPRE